LVNDQNPYASPRESGEPARDGNDAPVEVVHDGSLWPWRWGNYVLLPSECALPERCVLCGAISDRPMRAERVSAEVEASVMERVMISRMMLSLRQKHGLVFYTLCENHDRSKRNEVFLWVGIGLAIVQFFAGLLLTAQLRAGWPLFLLLSGFFTALFSVFVHSSNRHHLSVARIENGIVWLNLPRAFYEHLPQLPSRDGRTPIIPPYELADS
jgi:hypothetical protein